MSLKTKLLGQERALAEAEATIANLKAKLDVAHADRARATTLVATQTGELENARRVIEEIEEMNAKLHADRELLQDRELTVLGTFRVKDMPALLHLGAQQEHDRIERMLRWAHEFALRSGVNVESTSPYDDLEYGAKRYAEIMERMRNAWLGLSSGEKREVVEPKGCPTPGACSCLESDQRTKAWSIPIKLADGRRGLATALPDEKHPLTVRVVVEDGAIYDWPVDAMSIAPYESE